MARLSDSIEDFIKSFLGDDSEMLELQRNELAAYFDCAPSQINYVLTTRFSPERGYLIESRRGGGGHIKIIRLNPDKKDHILLLIRDKLGSGRISNKEAKELIEGLAELGMIEGKQQNLLNAAISDKAIGIPVPVGVREQLRASILREMLYELLKEE